MPPALSLQAMWYGGQVPPVLPAASSMHGGRTGSGAAARTELSTHATMPLPSPSALQMLQSQQLMQAQAMQAQVMQAQAMQAASVMQSSGQGITGAETYPGNRQPSVR